MSGESESRSRTSVIARRVRVTDSNARAAVALSLRPGHGPAIGPAGGELILGRSPITWPGPTDSDGNENARREIVGSKRLQFRDHSKKTDLIQDILL